LVATYRTAESNPCWLSTTLDPDGTSFWASNWCASSVTRFDLATGNVLETHLADNGAFHVKQILIPGNIFNFILTNTATVAGGGEVNVSNNSASDSSSVAPAGQPAPASNSIVNAVGFGSTVAAGSIASVFGTNLAMGQGTASSIPLPMTLGGSSIQLSGRSAPLFYASPTQVNLQVPWELAGQSTASVTATVGTQSSNLRTVTLAPFAPGIFTLNGSGSGQGMILIDGTALLVAPSSTGGRPALRGEFISIYSTGLGAVTNQPATGMAARAEPLSMTIATPTVSIGGADALVVFSGLAPGAMGLYQVNVQVPQGASVGDAVRLTLSVGGVASNSVTIAVQ
jgi:uncharacterized protein (TIGR03437 family)